MQRLELGKCERRVDEVAERVQTVLVPPVRFGGAVLLHVLEKEVHDDHDEIAGEHLGLRLLGLELMPFLERGIFVWPEILLTAVARNHGLRNLGMVPPVRCERAGRLARPSSVTADGGFLLT